MTTSEPDVLPPRPTPAKRRLAARTVVVWAVCGTVVTASVLYAAQRLGRGPGEIDASATSAPAPRGNAPIGGLPAAATDTSLQQSAKTADDAATLVPPRVPAPAAGTRAQGPERKVHPDAAPAKWNPVAGPPVVPAPEAAANAGARRKPVPASPPEAVDLRPTLAAAALPVDSPDRWKGLASAAAKCAEKGILAGLICEEKVRIEYCEGAWGKVPDCPRAQRNDP